MQQYIALCQRERRTGQYWGRGYIFQKGEGKVKKYIMVIDEGTTGTRALLFDRDFHIVSQSYVEFTQYTPSEDKVEHDAMEI